MNKIKSSCGRRGCSVRIVLPHDSGVKRVSSRVLRKGNDTKKVLPLACVLALEEAV